MQHQAQAWQTVDDVSESRHATEVMREVASLCHSHRLLPDGGAVADADGAAISGPRTLTWREREVLRLLGNGLSNSAIAVGLGVSVHTVRNHVHHILGKCRAHNRAEAVSLALRGLLL